VDTVAAVVMIVMQYPAYNFSSDRHTRKLKFEHTVKLGYNEQLGTG